VITLDRIRECELFDGLPDEAITEIEKKGEVITLGEGEVLFEKGDQGKELYVILEGMIEVTVPDPLSNKRKTLALLGKGEILGEMAILIDKDRSGKGEALRTTELFRFPDEIFHELTEEYPEIALNLSRILGRRLWDTDSEVQRVSFNTLQSRLSSQLLRLAKKFGKDVEQGTKIDIKLTHEMLADLVGTYRETITKKISDLKEKDVLGDSGDRILIKDWERLERISKG
jgi:CRP/FNR family transcriptional regulator